MHWTDNAIVLSTRKFGENKALAHVFSRVHGLHAGMVAGASSKANRGIIQPGNIVSVTWNARLSEHIGAFKAELLTPNAALVMQDGQRLCALSSACAMMEVSLPERHPYPDLYDRLAAFLHMLVYGDAWEETYVRLEMEILNQCGFGLDLSQCAATGTTDDLTYVSPKSGRAVSHEAGAAYRDKLLPLPGFLLTPSPTLLPYGGGSRKNVEILAGMRLSGYFLELWLLAPHNRKLPAARQRLINTMKVEHVEEAAT